MFQAIIKCLITRQAWEFLTKQTKMQVELFCRRSPSVPVAVSDHGFSVLLGPAGSSVSWLEQQADRLLPAWGATAPLCPACWETSMIWTSFFHQHQKCRSECYYSLFSVIAAGVSLIWLRSECLLWARLEALFGCSPVVHATTHRLCGWCPHQIRGCLQGEPHTVDTRLFPANLVTFLHFIVMMSF